MQRYIFLIAFILVLVTVTQTADPNCKKGKRAGSTCCAKVCSKCGGTGCGRNGLGPKCCSGKISGSGRLCNKVDPPCKITSGSGGNPGGGSNGGPATGGGKGTWKNIDGSTKGRPQARHEACFVMANGKGYLIGGRGTRGVDEFDPKTRVWKKAVAKMPTQMHHMQCVFYQGKIWIATSWFGGSPRESVNEKMWIFTVATKTWKSAPGLPPARRRGAAASVVFNDKLYVVAGNRGGHGPPAKTLGWFDYYDFKTKKWVTNLPNLPVPRDHVGGAMVNGQLCIAGGRNGGANSFFSATVPSTYCYNFGMKKWIKKDDIPAPRAGSAYGRTCGGKMMIAGGEGKFKAAFNRVDLFDGSKWTTLPSLKRARHGTGLAVANCGSCGQIFIASGSGARGGRPELESTEVWLPNGKDVRCANF